MSSSSDIKDKYRLNTRPRSDVVNRPRPLSHLELLASDTESDDGDEEEEEEDEGGGRGEEGRKNEKYATEILDSFERAGAKKPCQKHLRRNPGRKRCDAKNQRRCPLTPKVQNAADRASGDGRPKDLAELRADQLFLLKYGRENFEPRARPPENPRPKSSVETIETALARSSTFSMESSPSNANSSGLNPKTADARNRTPVRSKSWLSERDWRNLEGGPTGAFLRSSRSDYERALSSLLWQPYECRSETTTSSRNLDDSDVSYWLNSPSTWYRGHSNTSSMDSLSSSSSSELSYNDAQSRGAPYAPYAELGRKCREHDSTSSSLCGLINSPTTPDYRFHGASEWIGSQMQMVTDLNSVQLCFAEPPPGALRAPTTGSVAAASRPRRQSEPRTRVGTARSDVPNTMLVNIESGAATTTNNCGDISSFVDNVSVSSNISSSVGVVSAVPVSVQNKFHNSGNTPSVSDINCDFSVSNSYLSHSQPPASVTCYRAVPATVSSVPSILCQNSSNVSNIRINDPQNSVPLKPRVPQVSVNSTNGVQNIYIPPTSTNSPVYTLQTSPPKNHLRQLSDSQHAPKSQNVTLHCTPAPKPPSQSAESSLVPSNVDSKSSAHSQTQTHAQNATQESLTAPASWTDARAQSSVNRTFTSTEAQTDDVIVNPRDSATRDQRRRERRERRHQQRLLMNSLQRTSLNGSQDPPSWHPQTQIPVLSEPERLPDILNSHLPPPYSTLPPVVTPTSGQYPLGSAAPPNVSVLLNSGSTLTSPASPQHPQTPPSIASGFRFPFAIVPNSRRRRDCMNVWSNWTQEMRSRLGGRESHYTPEEEPKSCCGVSLSQTLAIRWFILVVFFLGLCCAVVGSVLGVMRISGREHLTVSILMIGVGIVLVAVSGVAWRMTSRDAPSCRVMLGLGAGEEGIGEPNRRFVPRLPPTYGRPHHPYAAMMYPEFQYRAPPPSYQASMQEYRLRLLLLDRNNGPLNTVSPPPTYRSHPGTILRPPINCRREPICHPPNQLDYSRPPSYRSRTSSTRPSCNLDPNAGDIGGSISTTHSRNPSQLSISDSGGNTVNVITVIGTRSASDTDSENIIKMVPDEPPLSAPLSLVSSKKDSSDSDIVKDSPSNIVTIVQSAPETNGSVIVTVTGTTTDTAPSHTCDTEMQILAHL